MLRQIIVYPTAQKSYLSKKQKYLIAITIYHTKCVTMTTPMMKFLVILTFNLIEINYYYFNCIIIMSLLEVQIQCYKSSYSTIFRQSKRGLSSVKSIGVIIVVRRPHLNSCNNRKQYKRSVSTKSLSNMCVCSRFLDLKYI